MEEFKLMKPDFENDLSQGVEIIIQGLYAQNVNKKPAPKTSSKTSSKTKSEISSQLSTVKPNY